MKIELFEKEDVKKEPVKEEDMKIMDPECVDLFFITLDSTYRLLHYGEIYREIYAESNIVRTIMEDKLYEELLYLLDSLKQLIDTCNVPSEDEINKIIEEFGDLEYINLATHSYNLIEILYDMLMRFYVKHSIGYIQLK